MRRASESAKILFSPLFLLGLLLLLLNDFYLKAQFHNFFTGKISDFAGLFVFPIFWTAFFPKRKRLIYSLTGIFFGFWKSQLSQPVIDSWNSFDFFRIGRTVDYTDFSALLIMPLSYFSILSITRKRKVFLNAFQNRIFASFIILLSVFAFTATSYEEDRNVWIDQKYEFKMSKSEFETKLKNISKVSNLEVQKETDAFPPDKYPDHQSDPNLYFVRFHLRENYCESDRLRVFSSIKEEPNSIILDFGSFNFWCKQKPTEEDKQKLIAIFESDVIENLRQNKSQ